MKNNKEGYFDETVLTDSAIELMEQREDNDFINELVWGISKDELPEVIQQHRLTLMKQMKYLILFRMNMNKLNL